MLINKLLSGAVRLWLQSQVSALENLKITIGGQNKQILQGDIPEVFLSANQAIYQGIHLTALTIKGTNIKFNLPQVIKRKPLKLLEPIVVDIEVLLLEEDLQKSVASPLLASGLTDLWFRFLSENSLDDEIRDRYQWHTLSLSKAGIYFQGEYQRSQEKKELVAIATKIELQDSHTLLLVPQDITTIPELPNSDRDVVSFDLGTQVTINQLEINSEQLFVKGTITIFP